MPKRLQSPSSINTFKMCGRKYYYSYIEKLPTKKSIHLVRGSVVHKVLEDFFDIDTSLITLHTYQDFFRKKIQELFLKTWLKNQKEIQTHTTSKDEETFYFSESMLMISNWLEQFNKRMYQHHKPNQSIQATFTQLTPIREQEFRSMGLYVRGFIDAIEVQGNNICIIDYKTNKHQEISEEQTLQLAIYALLYKEAHGITPQKAAIHFLRSKMKTIAITDNHLIYAQKEIEEVHKKTVSSNIQDYPKKPQTLCKWCDFYTICFEQKTLTEYRADVQVKQPKQVPQ